jgi:hypothetical protein
MLLDHLELLVGERPGLVDDRVGDGDLADVVEDAAVAQVLDRRLGESELTTDVNGQVRDRTSVVGRVAVLRLERAASASAVPIIDCVSCSVQIHRLRELLVQIACPDRGGEVLGHPRSAGPPLPPRSPL